MPGHARLQLEGVDLGVLADRPAFGEAGQRLLRERKACAAGQHEAEHDFLQHDLPFDGSIRELCAASPVEARECRLSGGWKIPIEGRLTWRQSRPQDETVDKRR